MPFPVTYHSWQTVNLTLCQSPLEGRTWAFCCVRAYAAGGFLCTHVRSERPKTHHIGGSKAGHARQPLGVGSGCTRASMPTKPRTRRPDELTMLLVDSRLYLRWLAIRASLNPLALIAFSCPNPCHESWLFDVHLMLGLNRQDRSCRIGLEPDRFPGFA